MPFPRPRLPRAACALGLSVLASLPFGSSTEPPADPDLAAIAWMQGHWRNESEKSMTEELWMPPRGGLMLGLNRSQRGKKNAAQFEYLRVRQTKKGAYYWASPGGGKSTAFRLTKATKDHAVFENPEHDFPKRIEYKLKGKVMHVSIAGDKPGPSWTLTRIGDVK